MDVLVIGDCHGEMPKIPEEDFELVLAVGDICGGTDEMRSAMFESRDSERHWYETFGDERSKKAVRKSIDEGKEILERLDSLDVPVLIVPGNWDWLGEGTEWDFLEGKGYPEMLEEFDNIHDLNFERKQFKGISFIGYGPCSGPEIPQYEDDRPDSEEEMAEIKEEYERDKNRLEKLFDNSENPVVFLSHNVPFETDLDLIDNQDSPVHGRHYGSLIVRELIEDFQPNLSVAGHMHEGEGEVEIGNTRCINTGLNSSFVITINHECDW